MPRVLFFGPAREATGCRSTNVAGCTVDDVIKGCHSLFGQSFADVCATAQIWVNGEQCAPDEALREGDEVAVIPPVSGG